MRTDLDHQGPTDADLAAMETALPYEERCRVLRYWNLVTWECYGAVAQQRIEAERYGWDAGRREPMRPVLAVVPAPVEVHACVGRLVEVAFADCVASCKVMACQVCGAEAVAHSAVYGCSAGDRLVWRSGALAGRVTDFPGAALADAELNGAGLDEFDGEAA